MWGSHRCTADGVGVVGAVDPGGCDVDAWSENVDEKTEVAERCTGVVLVGGTDGADIWSGCWRCGDGWETRVTSCDSEEHALLDSSAGGGVGHQGERATEREVEDGLADAALGLGILDSPVDSCENTGVAARSLAREDLHTDEVGPLGDTVGGAASGSSNVSSVSVAVGVWVALDEVGSASCTAAEIVVLSVDALEIVRMLLVRRYTS